MSIKQLFSYLLAILVSAIPAFFVIFNAIFSDVFRLDERLLTYGITVGVYGILGFLFGFGFPGTGWRWGIWLSLTGLLIAVWYSTHETGRLLLHLSYPLLAAGVASLAAHLGAQQSRVRQLR